VTDTAHASGARTEHPRPAAPAQRRWSRDRVETLVFGVLRWVVIAVLVVVTLFPMYYMVVLSLRSLDEVVLRPALLWPAEFDWSTYVQVLVSEEDGGQGFLVFLRNSAILAVLTVAFTLLAAIPGAYAISRLEFFGRRQVSALFLAVYLFPAILLAVPFQEIADGLRKYAGQPGAAGAGRSLFPYGFARDEEQGVLHRLRDLLGSHAAAA